MSRETRTWLGPEQLTVQCPGVLHSGDMSAREMIQCSGLRSLPHVHGDATVFYDLKNSIANWEWENQGGLDVGLDQLHSLKRGQADNDSFCGVSLNRVNCET